MKTTLMGQNRHARLKQTTTVYEMCLKECGLTTLETRRLRRDQIELFLNIEWV